jgi:hypothetical protein
MSPVLEEVPHECVDQGRRDDTEHGVVISRRDRHVQEPPSTKVREQPRPEIDDQSERSNVECEHGDILCPGTDPRTGLSWAEHLDDSDACSDDREETNCRQDGDCNQHGEKFGTLARSGADNYSAG